MLTAFCTKLNSLVCPRRTEGKEGDSDIGLRRRGLLRVVAITTANT